MNGIERITAKIVADAETAASAAREEARHQTADILDTYESNAAYIRATAREAVKKDAEASELRTASGVAMARRTVLLAEKSRAIDEAYAGAERYFLNMPEDTYCAFLYSVLSGVLKQKAENDRYLESTYGKSELVPCDAYTVFLGARDLSRFGDGFISGFIKEKGSVLPQGAAALLRLSTEPAAINGGLILRCGDVENNCSLSMLLCRARETGEAEVSALLFSGDKES